MFLFDYLLFWRAIEVHKPQRVKYNNNPINNEEQSHNVLVKDTQHHKLEPILFSQEPERTTMNGLL